MQASTNHEASSMVCLHLLQHPRVDHDRPGAVQICTSHDDTISCLLQANYEFIDQSRATTYHRHPALIKVCSSLNTVKQVYDRILIHCVAIKMYSALWLPVLLAALVNGQGEGLGYPPPSPVLLTTTKSGVLPVLPETPFPGVETLEGAIIAKGPPNPR